MAVADTYDALTAQDRPYKPAIPHEKSAAILRSMAQEDKLDGDLVELFLVRGLYRLPDADAAETESAVYRRLEEAVQQDGRHSGIRMRPAPPK